MRGVLLVFVLGVWGLQYLPRLPALWPVFLLVVPLMACLWLRCSTGTAARAGYWISLCAISGVLGFYWAAGLATLRLNDALPAPWEGRDIQLVGVVAGLPQAHERGDRLLFDVERVETTGAHVPRRISISDYASGHGAFHAGERWRLMVRLKPPHGSYNPHGFDFEAWALERNIRATGYIRPAPENMRLDTQVSHPAYLLERLRESVRARFRHVLGDARHAGVLTALAIGDDGRVPAHDWQVFMRTGITHLISISGLHVTMVASLVFALVSLLWRRVEALALRCPARKAGALAGMWAAGSYVLLAGAAIPAQRTFYMLSVVALALWSGRPIASSLVLCWALFVVVLFDPWAVLSPGFWLSFGAVALLMYSAGARIAPGHWLRTALHTQWVVTLGLVPLLLALFQQVSLISPLANAFAIPLISLVVTPLTLLGVVFPVEGLLWAAHAVMGWCMTLLFWCSELPVAVWEQHAPPAWTVVAAIAGVLWMLLPRGVPLRWAGSAAFVPLFLTLPAPPAAGELRASVLDVGQGLSVVVQTARHVLLYDTGPRYSEEADSGTRIILPFLRGSGITRLDGIILSHDDNDHTGGTVSVLQGIEVGWLASSLPAGHVIQNQVPRTLSCAAGQSWAWDGVRFEILHPAVPAMGRDKIKDNDLSCVLKVSSAHGTLLLAGDIERRSEMELLARVPERLSADVLVVPHHGSKTSSIESFVGQVDPSVAIFTAGYRNRFGHPKAEVVHRYQSQGSTVLRSDQDGAILLEYRADPGIVIQRWRKKALHYWLHPASGVAENSIAG